MIKKSCGKFSGKWDIVMYRNDAKDPRLLGFVLNSSRFVVSSENKSGLVKLYAGSNN